MCGIALYYHRSGITVKQVKQLVASLKRIHHRGPDSQGMVILNTETGDFKAFSSFEQNLFENQFSENDIPAGADLLLGHVRLSIVDLSQSGHQPMSDQLGNWIVFNGEIYNFPELKTELKSLGLQFKTNTDTEVILAAYKAWGKDCLTRFNGMFALVIWDFNKKQFFVANDRFGVKPLYYTQHKNELLIVSEQKQIFAFDGIYDGIVETNLKTFVQHGFQSFDETTLYQNNYRFKPAHYAFLKKGAVDDLKIQQKKYYTLSTLQQNISFDQAKDQFRFLLQSAVDLRMRADVNYAFALSGGLDSSAVLYAAINNPQHNNIGQLSTFSAVFPGLSGDESKFMKMVDQDLKVQANYVEPLKQFNLDRFIHHIDHQDVPVPTTSYFAEYALAEAVAAKGFKILLIGQGADELLGGYHHHFYQFLTQLARKIKIFKFFAEVPAFAKIKGLTSAAVYQIVFRELFELFKFKIKGNSHYNDLQLKWFKAKNLSEILQLDLMEYTVPFYLQCDDRDGMAFSIESRHPFLDYRLVDFVFSLPDEYKINHGWQKLLLREAMFEMPDEIRYRKDKKGFTTPQDDFVTSHRIELQIFEEEFKSEFDFRGNQFRMMTAGIWLSNLKRNAHE